MTEFQIKILKRDLFALGDAVSCSIDPENGEVECKAEEWERDVSCTSRNPRTGEDELLTRTRVEVAPTCMVWFRPRGNYADEVWRLAKAQADEAWRPNGCAESATPVIAWVPMLGHHDGAGADTDGPECFVSWRGELVRVPGSDGTPAEAGDDVMDQRRLARYWELRREVERFYFQVETSDRMLLLHDPEEGPGGGSWEDALIREDAAQEASTLGVATPYALEAVPKTAFEPEVVHDRRTSGAMFEDAFLRMRRATPPRAAW